MFGAFWSQINLGLIIPFLYFLSSCDLAYVTISTLFYFVFSLSSFSLLMFLNLLALCFSICFFVFLNSLTTTTLLFLLLYYNSSYFCIHSLFCALVLLSIFSAQRFLIDITVDLIIVLYFFFLWVLVCTSCKVCIHLAFLFLCFLLIFVIYLYP